MHEHVDIHAWRRTGWESGYWATGRIGGAYGGNGDVISADAMRAPMIAPLPAFPRIISVHKRARSISRKSTKWSGAILSHGNHFSLIWSKWQVAIGVFEKWHYTSHQSNWIRKPSTMLNVNFLNWSRFRGRG